jgi:FtsZ-binding cell division protein ZapB
MGMLQQVGSEETSAKASRIDLAIRSFCKNNGRNDLPRSKLRYVKQKWYRGYTKEESRKLFGYINKPLFRLYAYMNLESGLRARTVLAIRYKHIKQDLEAGLETVAIRFEPKFYYARGKKAGFTFIGKHSIELLRQCIKDGLISIDPEAKIFKGKYPYQSTIEFLNLAKQKAHLDPELQPTHGFRKYFENALDDAHIPREAKEMIEGHYPDTRAKHYSNRDFEYLRPFYEETYPFIDLEITDPRLPTKVQQLENELEELKMQRNILSRERNNLTEQRTDDAKAFIALLGTKEGRRAIRNAVEFADQLESNPTWQRFTSQLGQDAENRGGITPEEVTERVQTIYPRIIRQLRPDLRPIPPELREHLKKRLLGTDH